ncbi:AMP-binding protein, partial [Streptomyces actinomycinicus]
NSRADQLACELIARGVHPGDAVAVLLQRSPHTVTTVLALMKAGAVYVPLDTRYPAERIRHVLADTGAALVVTDEASQAELAPVPADLFVVDSVKWDRDDRRTAPDV